MKKQPATAEISWEGNSLKVLKDFPIEVRQNIGADLRRLQSGGIPLDFKPMKSIGKGVFELRDSDVAGWYRCIYLSKVGNTIYVLHSFMKTSGKTERVDLETAKKRLTKVLARIREAEKNEK